MGFFLYKRSPSQVANRAWVLITDLAKGLALETDSRSKASELKACSISLLFWAINPHSVTEPGEGGGFGRGCGSSLSDPSA